MGAILIASGRVPKMHKMSRRTSANSQQSDGQADRAQHERHQVVQRRDAPLTPPTEQEQIVEMPIVSLHGRLVPGRPAENARDCLGDGDAKSENRYDQHDSCRQLEGAIDRKAGNHEPEKLGSGVSKKHLRRIVVKDKESQDSTKQCYKDGTHGCHALERGEEEHCENNQRSDTTCKAVQSIDEVQRIRDSHDPEVREYDACDAKLEESSMQKVRECGHTNSKRDDDDRCY